MGGTSGCWWTQAAKYPNRKRKQSENDVEIQLKFCPKHYSMVTETPRTSGRPH